MYKFFHQTSLGAGKIIPDLTLPKSSKIRICHNTVRHILSLSSFMAFVYNQTTSV
jgi:hypothetical protein